MKKIAGWVYDVSLMLLLLPFIFVAVVFIGGALVVFSNQLSQLNLDEDDEDE